MTGTPRRAPLSEPAWQLRVLGADDHPVGGAVHLSPRFFVTCAHVVNMALGLHEDTPEHPGADARILLQEANGTVWEASVGTQVWSPTGHGIDLAVLWLTSPGFPDTEFPDMADTARLERDELLHAVGYPHGWAQNTSMEYKGRFGPTRASHRAAAPQGERELVTAGYSGCGVTTGSGDLVGLVQQNNFDAFDRDRPNGTVFLITTDHMPDGEQRASGSGSLPVRRMRDEARAGEVVYERLHDYLDSVPGRTLPHRHMLDDEEYRRTRERIGTNPTAWDVLMGVWTLVPTGDAPPLRLVWVHHALRELRRTRGVVPEAAQRWLTEEAREHLGDAWEQILDAEVDRRAAGPPPEPDTPSERGPAPEDPASGDRPGTPGTIVLFDVEPVTGGYKLSHGIAHRSGQGYDHREQETLLVKRYQIPDRVGDLVHRAGTRNGLVPERDSPRLSFLLPKRLLGLDLGSVTGHPGDRPGAPTLAEEYELVYHVRERVRPPRPAPARERPWRQRTVRQHGDPLLTPDTLLTTWDRVGEEVRAELTDTGVTVCAVETDRADIHSVYDAVLEAGVPTVLRGPRRELTLLLGELLPTRPDDRQHVLSLPALLRERAKLKEHGIVVVHDEHGDVLFRNAPGFR
ncbi:trypsin-like peptidase domain-containing protein [Nocardiopsis salina]|uniref:trypsin-like peptidase domain-containing protein n=1 Tax=Nocardiopsis salina TaxID=245836 RepID=UPI000475A255|nr:trypsin-like peptidase domain-containing protein [Nocardiopsis salina]